MLLPQRVSQKYVKFLNGEGVIKIVFVSPTLSISGSVSLPLGEPSMKTGGSIQHYKTLIVKFLKNCEFWFYNVTFN